MPTIITEGTMAAQAFGFGASSAAANYIEDVFSTYLYTGNGSTQTITNGINLSGKGGLVWMKSRSAATDHALYDTARGATFDLVSNTTAAQTTQATGLTAFGTRGFSIGALAKINTSAETYVSWSFRKQANFFDIVTYTGTGSNRTIAHNLGSTPGCIMVKRTDTTGNWQVYHSGLTSAAYSIQLNLTNGQASAPTIWNSTAPTSSVFSVGTDASVNASGGTYVAYIYASNAGGFGAAGTDNVITCGSFTGSNNPVITLGYEPQWILTKDVNTYNGWYIFDNMRGLSATFNDYNDKVLEPDSTAAETGVGVNYISATGFNYGYVTSTDTYIYIAIRRGPMKTPTDATKVFSPIIYTGNATAGTSRITGILTDMVWSQNRQGNAYAADYDRLRGCTQLLSQPLTNAETTQTATAIGISGFDAMSGYTAGQDQSSGSINYSPWTYVNWSFERAPGFFDEVCYTGTGVARTVAHNLGVVPTLMIIKQRSTANSWGVYYGDPTKTLFLNYNLTSASAGTDWNSATPTSTVFSIGTGTNFAVNNSGETYVAYLFATCPGVSKVGSYSGTGATQTINCGFTGGARFVMIKRTDSTGDWYVWDTARGMVSGTDPSLLLNSIAAEVNANSVYTATTGFQIVSTAAGINASGGSYIFLAIA